MSDKMSDIKAEREELNCNNYRTIPALAEYIDRIGAIQLHFRKFMVREYRGRYYVERSLITIDENLEIHCTNKEHEPTAEERLKIKGALSGVNWPHAIGATEAQFSDLKSKHGKNSLFYPIRSEKDRNSILMAQQRVVGEDGEKHYVPWCMFSDGEWRRMEPGGALPFWKPKQKTRSRIMVHEGAKAAEAAQSIAEDEKSTHPWAEEFRAYEHWGILGGALAPHRADYEELISVKPEEVVYVCDNDEPGRAVLQKFSEFYGRSLKGVNFGDDFPLGWDVADSLPQEFFDEEGVWSGPKLNDLMKPATRATHLIPNPAGEGRPVAVLTKEFASEWIHTVTPEFFVHRAWPQRLLQDDEFNSVVRPFSHINNTAGLLRGVDASKVLTADYQPSRKPGVYSTRAGTFINTYQPSSIEPEAGDVGLWNDYIEGLIPRENDRLEMQRWCATLFARPDIRMQYSLLLVSKTHGVGKTTLGEKIAAPIVGLANTSFPREKEIADSGFNSWTARKRLVVVNEIYAGQSSKVYQVLKSVVADSKIEVNEKFVKPYMIDNWCHIIASSNSLRALKMEDDDRRWFVPGVTEDLRTKKFWSEFNDWLARGRGLHKILGWAHDFLSANKPVMPGEHSPSSELKEEMIRENSSEGQTLITNTLELMFEKLGTESNYVVFDVDLVEFIKHKLYDGRHSSYLEKRATVRLAAGRAGWKSGKKGGGCLEWGIAKDAAIALSPKKELITLTARELYDMGVRRLTINDLMDI